MRSRVNVSEMIEYLLLRYDAMFRKNEIKVEQEIEKNCFAYGNRMYLERAVNNYLMNAFQHTEQGKRIRITLKKEKKQIRMEVYNDGAQIKEEQMEHIWDSFYTTSQRLWINIKEAAELKIWRTECCSGFNFRKSGIWENEKVE